jgi:hypothetical protein
MAPSLYYQDSRAVCDTQCFVHHDSSLAGAGGDLNVPEMLWLPADELALEGFDQLVDE